MFRKAEKAKFLCQIIVDIKTLDMMRSSMNLAELPCAHVAPVSC